jgi:DNA-binding MarR family transcriptional regulator
MLIANPVAASGTRTVAIPGTAGRISPSAPATSTAPMSLIWAGAKSSTQAIWGWNWALDRMIRMSQLAAMAQGSLSRLSHAVGRLERAGWVLRAPSPQDGRHIEAHLTGAGWKKIQEAAPGHVREARRLVVEVLTPTQLAQLGRAAKRIAEAAAPGSARRLEQGFQP